MSDHPDTTVEIKDDRIVVTTGAMQTVFKRGSDESAAKQICLLHEMIQQLLHEAIQFIADLPADDEGAVR